MIKDMPLLVFIGSSLSSLVMLNLSLILLGTKNIYTDKKFWVSTILLGIYMCLSYMITDNFIRTILLFLLITACSFFVQNSKNKNVFSTVLLTFFVWVSVMLVDVLCTIIAKVLLSEDILNILKNNDYLSFCSNLIVFIFVTLIFYSKKIRFMIARIGSNHFRKNENYYIAIVLCLSVILFSLVFYLCQFNYDTLSILIVTFIMVVVYTIVVIVAIKESNQKNKLQVEYDMLSENLSEYENLLDMQRVSNHENKNQLLVIKGKVDKKENNISEYISSIIDTQYADNDLLIMKTNRIPSGGLRGLVYYKMLTMKDKKIEVELEVDRSLRSVNFSNIPVKTNQELCKIVGVFLDNAIQAVEKLKVKKIDIVLNYIEDKVTIKISNNYDGSIDIDKISEKGYTTKGKGHGYGLSLVKQIVDGNDRFTHDTEVNGKLFSQIIKLSLK